MDSRPLPPIPTPPAQRWREVRLLYLPRVLFIAGAVLVAWMWNETAVTSAIVAEAEATGSDLRSTQAGVISSLKVSLYQSVRAGEVVGQVSAVNPRLLDASLAVIRAEVGMLIAADSKRVAVEFERLQLEWIKERVDRAVMLGEIQQIEADIARAEPLHRAGLVTDDSFSQLKIKRDSLQAQARERAKLIDRIDPGARSTTAPDPQRAALSGESALAAAIKVQEAKLKLTEEQLTPQALVAPIDGVVSLVLRRTGEAVAAGEPVLRVTAQKPERLTGFMRQPLAFQPKAGMAAEIRTRSLPAKVAQTSITAVGVAHEVLSPTMIAAMRLPAAPAPETALRVEFALPPGLDLRPGEHVDITVR